ASTASLSSKTSLSETAPLVPGWPDAIKCTSSGGAYIVLPNWTQDSNGIFSYGTPKTHIQFDATQKIVGTFGFPTALAASDCQIGSALSGLTSFVWPKN